MPEALGDVFQARRVEPRPGQDDAQGVDVAAAGDAAQQRGFQDGGAAAHERVIDDLAGLRQALDEEARQLRLEAGAIGNLVERAGLALFGGPEFVDERGDFARLAVGAGEGGDQLAGGLAELAEGRQFLGQGLAAGALGSGGVVQGQLGSLQSGLRLKSCWPRVALLAL